MIDFRNVNTLWTSVLVETCQRLGLTTAVISPGSRSTPLTVAFARHPQIETIPILDERSAAFFALGRAKRTGIPTVLICTSGTAGANFYPAVVEATQSHIPLIILTADRPPELRNCRAGQTIDQIKLYGSYPNWYCELALPEASLGMLRYLRQNIIQAWERSLYPLPGVIHLNLPFREPLAPISPSELGEIESQFDCASFFEGISRPFPLLNSQFPLPLKIWQSYQRGIIIAGLAQPHNPELYCRAIAKLAHNENLTELALQLEHFLYLDFPQIAAHQEEFIDWEHLLQWWQNSQNPDSDTSTQDSRTDRAAIFWALLLLSAQSKVELSQEEFYQDLRLRPLKFLNL